MGTYSMLDLMPKGRDERDVPYKMEWMRHHDPYPQARQVTKAAATAAAGCGLQHAGLILWPSATVTHR